MSSPAQAHPSTTPARGAVRLLRAAVPAVAAVLVAVGGHVAGGGAVPSVLVLGLVSTGAAMLSMLLAAQRWTARTVLGLLVALQAVVHLTCSLSSQTMGADGSTAAMLTWHVVATAVTTAVLCWGESVLWSLVDVLGLRRVDVLLSARVPVDQADHSRVVTGSWVPLRLRGVTRRRLRGPPLPAR
ncbi:MAG: hypothetical protein Q7T56_14970 [Nocardioidaceae bacterium]|nr:hypothetical protein [Nocardioidaceae bacterium]